MTDLTLKKIEEVLDKKLDQKLESIKKKLDEHSDKLDALTLDMIDVQKKTDLLPDLHSMIKGTKEKVDDHEERIQRLENAA
ncbi:hypothetical protein A3B51_03565 [Candidatus Curtissbacteria bacterium RIFCSPLOWO2_01_FULL_41_18]|uniref:Uncharacterized protein n=2 Tax=Candidatus Curtissiibacteriota TaxID=1752717 RepID=A0A1F5G2R0_9BACT|nr:MAG: hypothetical protein A2696_02690 [Candidatus Curtissbacteria bacterium RIFCSPHIGHO2_01_FULL_41_13]OGE04846.1 MAG: hypothetical protein A3B51_03565 [Candidatus Curtissbacteria bacterium RIFCSPLOWO2_01_FULL_41_18]